MSALGQKQTCRTPITMSALPPKADMCAATKDVRYGPIAIADILNERLMGYPCRVTLGAQSPQRAFA